MRMINTIVIHCTATREGVAVTKENVDSWHKERGWSGIGYHFLVHLDGRISRGRDVSVKGAHVKGHNSNSIGVCYVGGLDWQGKAKDTRTDAQVESLMRLLMSLKVTFPDAKIVGHNYYNADKYCPSFDAESTYQNLKEFC